MTERLEVNVSTGQARPVPLTPDEQSDFDARVAAAPAAAAALAIVMANQSTLQQRAQAALAANATYLALATPTAAQVGAQVAVLTKECSALIRLLLNKLDDVSGT